jgi:NADH-quinone oxidoreductase subunit M
VSQNYALVGLVLTPLVGSALVFALGDAQARLAKQLALFFSLAAAVYAVVLCFAFDTGAGASRFQFTASWNWIRAFGVHIAFGVDGIALVPR